MTVTLVPANEWRPSTVTMEHQPRLWPLLDVVKQLCQEGLTVAIILSAIHHLWVLPLMDHLLRMDEMGPRITPEDLEACRMSREALPGVEIVTRVRAIIANAFRVESVKYIPMMPDEGYLDLVSASSYTTLFAVFLMCGCFHIGENRL